METLRRTQGGWPSPDGAGLGGNGVRRGAALGESVRGSGYRSPLCVARRTSLLASSSLKIQPPFGVRRRLKVLAVVWGRRLPIHSLPDCAWLITPSALSLAKELGAPLHPKVWRGPETPLSSPQGRVPPFLPCWPPWERVHLAQPCGVSQGHPDSQPPPPSDSSQAYCTFLPELGEARRARPGPSDG